MCKETEHIQVRHPLAEDLIGNCRVYLLKEQR